MKLKSQQNLVQRYRILCERLPSREKATAYLAMTFQLLKTAPLAESHTRTVLSPLSLPICLPSREKATELTQLMLDATGQAKTYCFCRAL